MEFFDQSFISLWIALVAEHACRLGADFGIGSGEKLAGNGEGDGKLRGQLTQGPDGMDARKPVLPVLS